MLLGRTYSEPSKTIPGKRFAVTTNMPSERYFAIDLIEIDCPPEVLGPHCHTEIDRRPRIHEAIRGA